MEASKSVGKASDGGAPTCASCHKIFPHAKDWVKKENHGAHVLANGKNACATQCHGFDLKGGLSKISCNTCHSIYPHTATWASPAEHGVKAKKEGKLLCRGCHGDDYKGGLSEKSCNQCHANYPHINDWGKKESHGAYVLANGKGNCTTQCHGVDLNGGLSQVACSACHSSLYPHTMTWVVDHREAAARLGNTACQGCHGADYAQVLNGKSCNGCHADYPHPDRTVWEPFTTGHGKRVQTDYEGSTAECEKCHGADLTTMKQGQNCFSCHPSFPHEKISSTWKQYEGHGSHVLGTGSPTREDVKNAIKECKMCHEHDSNNYSGGLHDQPSCFSCHPPFPHLTDDWVLPQGQPQGHGNYVSNPSNGGTTSCATAHCHGVNLAYVAGTTRGNSCVGCHTVYPHPAGWVVPEGQPQGHGARALSAGIDACKGCHSDSNGDFQRRINGHKNCYDCHADFPHLTGWEQGTTGHGPKAYGSGKDSCAKADCHGAQFQGNPGIPACSSCHSEFPHLNARWATVEPITNDATTRDNPLSNNPFHGDRFIRKSLSGNTTDCTMCHGVNLDRDIGVAGLNFQCTKCHLNGVTHKDMPAWRLGMGHGKFFSDSRFQAVDPTTPCWKCHGSPADFTAQTTDASLTAQSNCYNCHKTYPHITWSGGTWEPVDPNVCGPRNADNFAHMNYVDEHNSTASPFNTAATCGGGTNGTCHKDGLRAYGSFAIPGCSYCHSSLANNPPSRPDCGVGNPPDSIQRNGPPVVLSSTPAQGAMDVEPSNSIAVQFNEAMNKASVEQAGTFTLRTTGGTNVTATVTCSSDWCRSAILTLPPSDLLLTNMTYVIAVTTQAKDWGGTSMAQNFQSTFSTRPPDTTPPRIDHTLPSANEINAPTGRYIYVYFNEPLQSASVVSNAISVTLSTGYPVAGTTSCTVPTDCSAIRFRFNGRQGMSFGTTYIVNVSPDVKDLAGNRLGTQPSWQFKTVPQLRITAISPGINATNVPIGQHISVAFSEAVLSSSVANAITVTSSRGTTVSGTTTCDDPNDCTEISFQFTSPAQMSYSTTYTVNISPNIRDAAGNTLGQQIPWSFTTIPRSPLRIDHTKPSDGATNVPIGRYISVYFTEPVQPASVVDAITVDSTQGFVTGATTCSDPNNCTEIDFLFTQPRIMSSGTKYKVTISPTVKDMVGNLLGTQSPWVFETAP